MLRAATHDHALVAALQRDDWTLANLDDKDRTLLSFARALNATPAEISAGDIERLRAVGFTDENIFDVVMIVAFFNFINRVADGIGVAPEPEAQESCERHLQEVLAAPKPTTTRHSA